MTEIALQKQQGMRRALVWSNILSEPLSTLYALIGFILCKDLGATVFQIALLTTLKPVVTVLCFYWSAGLKGRSNKLKSNVIWAGIWMRAPFLLCPWFDSVWFVIAAAVNYMFFHRAGSPAWLEILRRNLSKDRRSQTFSLSSALGYCEGALLSIAMGVVLDGNPGLWKIFFCIAAAIGLITVFVQRKVPVEVEEDLGEKIPLKELIIRPWRDSYRLIREQPEFARFQWGFMICGSGIMLIQPVLPLFIADTLGVSYLEMLTARSIAGGLGFAASSPIWSRWLDRIHISRLASLVFLVVGLFPLFLVLSTWSIVWLYVAFFLYGVGQGGSHLVWNLSGPVFAGKEESSRYTGVGVVLAGLRGGVAPSIGGIFAAAFGSIPVFLFGGSLCFYSGLSLLRYARHRFLKNDLV